MSSESLKKLKIEKLKDLAFNEYEGLKVVI